MSAERSVESRSGVVVRSLAGAASWLARFVPPFEFGPFFAPEDTVLCALATRGALGRVHRPPGASRTPVELTAGGAVVLADALLSDRSLHGVAADVDGEAVERARRNLARLGLDSRAEALRCGLFHRGLARWLRQQRPAVVACNPPYVPEPPDRSLALVAGAGPRGDRHPRRVLRVAAAAEAPRVVLSWCSLGDPVRVARAAARHGYRLERLHVAAIADGEWTGEVHPYLRTLGSCFLHEGRDTLRRLAPDGAARFAYLLLAGSFVRDDDAGEAARADRRRRAVRRLARLVGEFRDQGIAALERAAMRHPHWLRPFTCDRLDELRLRRLAHGTRQRAERASSIEDGG